MPRSAWTLLLALPLVAVAAPVPKETEAEKIEKLFGKIEDPEKDCKFALDGTKLKITLKGGKRYDYDLDGKVKNCPRVLREVKGDFVMTAKIIARLPDKAEPGEGDYPETAAGLMMTGEGEVGWRAQADRRLGQAVSARCDAHFDRR